MMATILVLVALLLLMDLVPATAQTPVCEDRLREHRAYVEIIGASRTRQEVEAARVIADLQKRVEQLQADLDRLRREAPK